MGLSCYDNLFHPAGEWVVGLVKEFGKGIEAHPAPDMSKQLEALQLTHTDEREKANSRIFRRVPEKPYELTFHLTEKSKRTCESHIFY